jgi:membrane-associated phospholipid phosphatase
MRPPDEGAVHTAGESLPGVPDGRAAADRPRSQAPSGSGEDGRRLRPDRPLLAAPARPWADALLACCATAVAVLGVLLAHRATPGWLDHAVDSPVIGWFGGHQGLASWLAAPGSLIPAAALSAVIVVACLLAGRLNGAVLAAAAVPAAVGLNDGLLKPLVHRTYLGALSYPSGHTAAMFALAATVTVLVLIPPQPARTRALRALIPLAAYVAGVVVAVAVIGLRWHYFTDTVAGAAVGTGTVCGLALILDLPAPSRWLARVSRRLPRVRGRSGRSARPGPGAPA